MQRVSPDIIIKIRYDFTIKLAALPPRYKNFLLLAQDLNYIDLETCKQLGEKAKQTIQLINGLIRSIEKPKNNNDYELLVTDYKLLMQFDIITIFPEIFDSYFTESLLKRAQEKNLLKIGVHNLRDWTQDAHKTVDDTPFGGGLGMVLKVEPISQAVSTLKTQNLKLKAQTNSKDKNPKQKVILFTPRGKKFTQKKATEYAKLDQLIMICGRYEGVDERVGKYIADEQISIGDYDLMGGELPAMVVLETVARLIPGVIGKKEFLQEHVQDGGFIEYPQYTRPESIEIEGKKRTAPKVLISGDHKKIDAWRAKHGKIIK